MSIYGMFEDFGRFEGILEQLLRYLGIATNGCFLLLNVLSCLSMINFLRATGGYLPFIGMMIGICVGALVGFQGHPTKIKPATWAALVGAIAFGLATVFDHSNRSGAIAIRILSAALGGAICCWLWGLLGGVIGRKLPHRRRKIAP